jgi:hypothetical protein
MTADFAHTLGAISPEYAEAAGGEVEALAKAGDLVGDDIAYWLGNPFVTPDLLGDKVCWWIERARQAAADAVLAEARAMCCDADTSKNHTARAEHSRVMAIAERLAAAVRGMG